MAAKKKGRVRAAVKRAAKRLLKPLKRKSGAGGPKAPKASKAPKLKALKPRRSAKRAARSKKSAQVKENAARDYAIRADKGGPIEPYLEKASGEVGEVLRALAALIREAVPDATAEIKWGMPVFSRNGLLCYLRASSGYVRFGFYDHVGAFERAERIEGSSDSGGHVRVSSMVEIDRALFTQWVQTCARMNTGG